MRIVDCIQGTELWWLARCGIPTASRFDAILSPVKAQPSTQQEAYICDLIADRISGPALDVEQYTNRHIEHGKETEASARAWYGFQFSETVEQVGFCTTDDGRFGCSPDGLVGDDGGLELKCPMASTHVGYLLAGELPRQYKCQVHGSLIVTGRAWWSFMSFVPGFPVFHIRVEPDDFTKQLADELEVFAAKYADAWARIKAMDIPDQRQQSDEDAALAMFAGR